MATSKMTYSNTLDEEIKNLEKIFTKDHERFQILSSTAQEIKCCFIAKEGKRYGLQANMSPSYPSTPAIWFAETEDGILKNVIHKINMASVLEQRTHITNQVNTMLRELCEKCDVPLPSVVYNLKLLPEQLELPDSPQSSEEQHDPDDKSEQPKTNVDSKIKYTYDKLALEKKNKQFLNRLRHNLKKTDNINGKMSTSTKRLMIELSDVYESFAYKKDMYTVDIVNDSIYEWNVNFKIIDHDSALYRDLQELKKRGERDYIQLNMIFKEEHPFEPPFVRVIYPILSCGFVLNGGAICMGLLTKHGWTSGYVVESVIMQIGATLSKANARVKFEATKNDLDSQYNLAIAKGTFKYFAEETCKDCDSDQETEDI